MLEIIDDSLNSLLGVKGSKLTTEDRLNYFSEITEPDQSFTRKDYMQVFKEISSATASRDLKTGVDSNYFQKSGDKKNTLYHLIQQSRSGSSR
ncbi:hypothetical protein D3C86_1662680 [compost metagenome]